MFHTEYLQRDFPCTHYKFCNANNLTLINFPRDPSRFINSAVHPLFDSLIQIRPSKHRDADEDHVNIEQGQLQELIMFTL